MAADETPSAPPTPQLAGHPGPYVVGIGASAGGLAALQILLDCMPDAPGFACVIVVHLSAEHESHLPELLQSHTAMRVQQVTTTVALEPNHVYVIPPNANLSSIDTHLRLTQLEERRIERAPIDHFLRTLASTHDGTAIGVILTGAGSDGTLGLRHIRECGGLTIAQDPEEAEADSMPRSAIAAGMVDLVLPVGSIADEIVRFCATHPLLPVLEEQDESNAPRDEGSFGRILTELRKYTQHDFSVYRQATLLRRLRRRMQLLHVTTFSDYLGILSHQPQEAQALANDLALLPTEFFRDHEAFQALSGRFVPQIFARKARAGGRVRLWSIGCATGEEAYSLGMLLLEEQARHSTHLPLQVFASDVSDKVLGIARNGFYPKEIAATVSAERLEHFFTSEGGGFKVTRELQEIVLFASHNPFMDPPFGHVDLIVCRTLLSDLQPDVRRGMLNLFHYSLEPDGLLMVGRDDRIDAQGLFEADSGAAHLLCKVSRAKRTPLPQSMQPFGQFGVRALIPTRQAVAVGDVANVYRASMERYMPAGVMINADNQVVHFSANARDYIHIPGGEPTNDLLQLVREPIRSELPEGLGVARDQLRPWCSAPMSVASEHGIRRIVLRVEPVSGGRLVLVVFEDERANPSASPGSAIATIAELEGELGRLQQHLRRTLESRRAGDAGGLMREELERPNQELHSVLEELATSKEELQAVNEELVALDDENRRRVQELTQISTDLQHLLASTGVATLFLDTQLRIVRFTPQLGELFGVCAADLGRPVSDLARLAHYEGFELDARRVLEQQQPLDRELPGPGGRWYLSRVLPYRTDRGAVDGVVLTLIDISERKRAELALQEANRQKDEFLAVLAHELRNPLAPISSGIEVLKAASGDARTVDRIAATMGRQTHQLVRLVDDLLEVSRISGGKLRLRTAVLDLRDVIQDAVASVRPSIEKARHSLEVSVAQESLTVEGDGARLTQVLSNLLNNAVRYTPQGGVIAIIAGRADGGVEVRIKDNGVGISHEALAHVFDMFYQGRNARSGFSAGLGIGLTLAKTLIEMHRGTISADSSGENGGSEFRIWLPLGESASAAATATATPACNEDDPPLNTDHCILIVDDNVDAAETLSMLMKSLGERAVHTANSGAQALQTAQSLHPDVVLLDLMMPEMDGYEVARRMRSEPWAKDLLLVALSGWGHEEHRRRSKEAGFDRHVTKPADLRVLRSMLNDVRRSTTPAASL